MGASEDIHRRVLGQKGSLEGSHVIEIVLQSMCERLLYWTELVVDAYNQELRQKNQE